MNKMVQTEDLIVGKRYYFTNRLISNGVYKGVNENGGIEFDDIKNDIGYIHQDNNSAIFGNVDLTWYEYED